jgi:RadC-like JAB domain
MNSEKQTADICRNRADAETFWRESVKGPTGFDAAADGVFIITLDGERHFKSCHQIVSRVFRSSVLFADEVMNSKVLQGVEEFIVLHNRPGLAPKPDPEDKARAREIALAAQHKNFALLDYIIIGKADDKYPRGSFSAYKRLAKWMEAKKP